MPGGRRNKFITVDGQQVSKKTRPWALADDAFYEMADAGQRINLRYVQMTVKDMAQVTSQIGSRHRLRGRNGQRIPLEGKGDARGFQTRDNGLRVVGVMRGIPEGFWHIVENGRGGGYIVYSRKGKGGAQRLSKSGKARQDFLTKKQVQKRFNQDKALSDLAPVRTPFGPRQWVLIRSGHGPLGTPWKQSMQRSEQIVSGNLTAQANAELARAWKG